MWLQAPVFPLDNGDFNSQPTQDQSTGSSLQRGGKMNAGVNFQKTVQKMWPFFKKNQTSEVWWNGCVFVPTAPA